jgi:hypothetical protein
MGPQEETLRIFLHPPPPWERESLIRVAELTIPKVTALSTQKGNCENYLFEDDYLQSRMTARIIALGTPGRIQHQTKCI